MKISKYINFKTLALLSVIGLAGCADDIDYRTEDIQDGTIQIQLEVPEAVIVSTRAQSAEEKAVNNLTVFVFNADGSELYDKVKVNDALINNNIATVVLNDKAKGKAVSLYAIANAEITNTVSSIADLEQVAVTGAISLTNGLPMTGKTSTLAAGTHSASLALNRIVAKVSMAFAQGVSNYTLQGFDVVKAADGVLLGMGTGTATYYTSANSTVSATATSNCQTYIYPSRAIKSQSTYPTYAYVILRAKAKDASASTFYRIDLYTKNGEGKQALDFEANHEYQIQITNISHPGYPSADEAAKYPIGDAISYDIYDYHANVLSMATDGSRELGVTREVTISNSIGSQFIVKCYSKTDAAEENTKPTVDGSGVKWLNIVEGPAPVVDASSTPGKAYSFTVTLKDNAKIYSDETAVVKVSWMGLTREVTVKYDAAFQPSDACTVTLKYGGDKTQTVSANYWDYIISTVKGFDPDALVDGKIRNQGLHFPMPYGSSTLRTYSYDINFTPSTDGGNSKIKNVTIATTGDSFFNLDKLSWTYNASTNIGSLSLKSPSKDYTYATGQISFIIEYEDGERILTVDLYHTGFFHEDTYFDGATSKTGVLYYEVVGLGGKYWLDRNLGATSNKMFLDNGTSAVGNTGARGNYYKIADVGTNYTDPIMKYTGICPPGYVVPNSTDWDGIRLSPNFTSSNEVDGSANYIASYYNTGNAKIGKVYFPKSRFINKTSNLASGSKVEGTPNSGDAGSGYYWSTSNSAGLEKEEIGNWLKVLNLAGSSNTYINGSINLHMMNVRCIASDSHADEQKYAIDFNVKGATHVYLYSVDNLGNKSGVFSFPGKAIGSQQAVDNLNYSSNDSYLHFSYTSTISASKLYVFFAYVTSDGKITLISENNATSVDKATGWPVKVGYNYFFNKNSNFAPIRSENNFPWPASGTSSTPDATNYFVADRYVTIDWPTLISNTDMYKVYIWYGDGTKQTADFPGDNYGVFYNENGAQRYTYEFKLKKSCDEFKVIFSRPDEGQTGDITINKNNATLSGTSYTVKLNNLSKR